MDISADAQAISDAYLAEQALTKPPSYHGRLAELADPTVVDRLLKAVHKGLSKTRAADLAGVSRTTLHAWERRAEAEPESAYGTLLALLKTREAEFIERQHERLEAAAEDDSRNWAARMTLLERRFPDEYGRRTDDSATPRVVVQIGVQNGDVQVAFAPSSAGTERKLTE